MPQVPKNAALREGHTSQVEIQTRQKAEELFGAELTKDLKPSNRLNANQKKLFNAIVEHYRKINVMGDIDGIFLETLCIAIDRLQSIEKMVNQDFELIRDRELMAAKTKYTADLLKGVDMFGMSPLSRAKFGILTAKAVEEEKDPLLKVLNKSS